MSNFISNKKHKYRIGISHGRFQILHNDHMKYLLAGKELCEHLIVGITNPDPFLTRDSNANPHRSTPIANPLTYYERYVMIEAALKEKGLNSSEFSIVPFPINIPELIKYYVPMDATFFLTVYDDWGKQKKEYFESLGVNIHVLWEVSLEEKGLSSINIRKSIILGVLWEHLVPPSVAKLMKKWNIPLRLKKLNSR